MHTFQMRRVAVVVGLTMLLLLPDLIPVPKTVHAQDVKALLNQFNKDIRQVQRDMFSGKDEKAIAALEGLQGLLTQIETLDPSHPQLKTSQNKYNKLIKDLERKTGRDLGGGSATVSAGSTPKLAPEPKPKPLATAPAAPAASPKATRTGGNASAQLPHRARRPYSQAENRLQRVDSTIQRLSDPAYGGNKQQLVTNGTKLLEEAKALLVDAKQKSLGEGVDTHPQFDQMAEDIAAAEARLNEAKAAFAQALSTAKASAGQVNADVEVLKASYDAHRPLFDKATGTAPYYNDLEPLKELIGKIETFESNDQRQIEQSLSTFAAKYGDNRQQIDQKTEAAGYTGQTKAGFYFEALRQGVDNIKKTRRVTADDLIRRAKDMQTNAERGLTEFNRIASHTTIRQWGEAAERFDAQSPQVQAFMNSLDEWIQNDMAALNAKIDKATFPAQAANAPQDAAHLAKVSQEYLQERADADIAKGAAPRKIIKVSVTGTWQIFKRNLLGEPIQYGLPVAVAEVWESEKDQNLARVYQMSMLTETFKGVKQAPPFIGAAVGDSHYMRVANIK